MDNANIRHASVAYDAAGYVATQGDWEIGVPVGNAEAAELWQRMTSSRDPMITPELQAGLTSSRVRVLGRMLRNGLLGQETRRTFGVLDPMTKDIIATRIRDRFDSVGIQRDINKRNIRSRLAAINQGIATQNAADPRALQIPPIPDEAIGRWTPRERLSLYEFLVREHLIAIIATEFGAQAPGDDFNQLSPAAQGLLRETLVRSVPQATLYDENSNATWVNDPAQVNVRADLRALMGDDAIPRDGGDPIEMTPDLVALTAYLRRPSGNAGGANSPIARLRSFREDRVGGDVSQAEEDLRDIRALYDPIKEARDDFNRGAGRYADAANDIDALREKERDRLQAMKTLEDISRQVTAAQNALAQISTPPPQQSPLSASGINPNAPISQIKAQIAAQQAAQPPTPTMPPPPDPRIAGADTRLNALLTEQRAKQAEVRRLTTDTNRLRSAYRRKFRPEITANAGLYDQVTAVSPDAQADIDQAIQDLETSRDALFTEQERQLGGTTDPQRALTAILDKDRSFADYTDLRLPRGINVTQLRQAGYENFRQLEEAYTTANSELSTARRDASRFASDPSKRLNPTQILYELHMSDPDFRQTFGNPEERQFRAMVSTMLSMNKVRNRELDNAKARRLAEFANTRPEGFVEGLAATVVGRETREERLFADYVKDVIYRQEQFRGLREHGFNKLTSTADMAAWIGFDDQAVITLEAFGELIQRHIRPLLMDQVNGARLALSDTPSVSLLLERMEAVYYTAYARQQVTEAGANPDRGQIVSNMLGGLLATASGRPVHFPTNVEAGQLRSQPYPGDEPAETEEGEGSGLLEFGGSVLKAMGAQTLAALLRRGGRRK